MWAKAVRKKRKMRFFQDSTKNASLCFYNLFRKKEGCEMSKCIMITSGKGGVGKSTVTASLAVALAKMNQKVLCVDLDLGLRNLDVVLGLENRLIYDMKDVVAHRCTLQEAFVQDKRMPNLFLLSACRNMNLDKIRLFDCQKIIEECKGYFDVVLLDCPAGIERGFQYAMACADEAYVVVQLDITSLMDADRVVGLLMRQSVSDIKMIVNRVNPTHIKNKVQCSIKEAREYLSLPLQGIVYEDPLCIRAMNYGHLASSCSTLTERCFETIAKRLLGIEASIPKYERKSRWMNLLQHD